MRHIKGMLIVLCFIVIGNSLIKAQTEQSVKDFDGNVYKTVKIGNQTWMTENLKTTHFNDGTAIPYVTDNTDWVYLTTPGYCWYENNPNSNKNTYGALYNWWAVKSDKLCPKGWHIPTDAEWITLIDFLGGLSIAGGKMKESGLKHWESPNTGATDEYGFTALPGGYRFSGIFTLIKWKGYWWSSTEYNTDKAWYMIILNNYANIYKNVDWKRSGLSVRCIKD
ncbi:MAG: FISUMP domain-containing protein [Bacteroidales bacterium]|nr:fibrobacter succinogenes major paralogous domain-containing protein [Bacteroidales bacterium]MDD4214024.1 FISUMP domain-containing protein [Bacteroidales bacterium]